MGSAIAYIRKSSTPSRATRTVSHEVQEQAVRELAGRHGDELGEVLTDWGRSGGSTKRPDYQRLLGMVDRREVETVYSYSLSRLSRSLLDFADLLERCRAAGVRIRLVQEGEIDWSSATGRAFAGMAALFAQFERELGSERNQAAVDERRGRGDVLGQPPYGYSIDGARLVPRDGERPDLVFNAFRQAGSFGGAARLLNEWGVPTRRQGTRWVHGVVADIIRAQAPADLRPALVKRRAAAPVSDARLAGLLRCHCGATLTPRRDKGIVHGYYCSRSVQTPGHGRMFVSEAAVLPFVQARVDALEPPIDMVEIQREHDDRRAGLDAQRARVVDLYVIDPKADRAAIQRRLATIDAQLAELDEQVELVDLPEIDWRWSGTDVNRLLRLLIDHVQLGADMRPLPDGLAWRGTIAEWAR